MLLIWGFDIDKYLHLGHLQFLCLPGVGNPHQAIHIRHSIYAWMSQERHGGMSECV